MAKLSLFFLLAFPRWSAATDEQEESGLLQLKAGVSARDLARAKQVVPGATMRAAHADESNALLNKHLLRIARGRAKPCNNFSLAELEAVSERLHEREHMALRDILTSNEHPVHGPTWQDPRGAEAVSVNYDSLLQLPHESFKGAMMEKLCYELAQTFTHRVPDAQKSEVLREVDIPLLPPLSGRTRNAALVQLLDQAEAGPGGGWTSREEPRVRVPKGDPASGEAVFETHCSACHSMEKGDDKSSAAPNLDEIVGGSAGARSSFPYSNAMKQSGIVWSPKHLFVYLKNPTKYVPGTKMSFPGISSETERADLVAFLQDPWY